MLIYPWTAALICSAAALVALWLKERAAGRRPWDEYPGLFLFLLSLTVYLSTLRWHGGDDIPNSLLPFSILRHGTLSMEPFRDWFAEKGLTRDFTVEHGGTLLSVFPIAPGILALPVFAPAVWLGVEPNELILHNLSKTAAAILCALSTVVFHRIVAPRASRPWALSLTVLYAFGTYAFSVSSQSLYAHGPAQLGVLLGLWGMLAVGPDDRPRTHLLAGAGLGLAVAARPDSVFFLAAAGLHYLLSRRRDILPLIAGAAIPLGLNAAYWLYYVGRLEPPEARFQANLFSAFQWESVVAMLLSPTRGMLFLTPAALFGFWGLAKRRAGSGWAGPLLAAAIAATWVFLAFRGSWAAGQTFGNRYFAVVCAVLLVFCADIEEDLRRSPRLGTLWACAFVISIAVHAAGGYLTWPGSFAITEQLSAIWDLRLYPPAAIFFKTGALGALPLAARIAVAALLLIGAAFGVRLQLSQLKVSGCKF